MFRVFFNDSAVFFKAPFLNRHFQFVPIQTGPIGAWKICPLLSGIGYATTVITFLMNIYYIVILAWSLYFMFMSFSTVLPWAHCNNPWNTKNCYLPHKFPVNASSIGQSASEGVVAAASRNMSEMVDPAIEFWERKVLRLSTGVDDMGSIIPELALCLFIVWVLVFFALFKGMYP